MITRRSFIKNAGLVSSALGIMSVLPESLQKALSINPEPGTTFYDAEHIVLLMQENRSFDHAFGTLQGVRGFNDPRAIHLPNNNKVWLQSNKKGETYAPFHFDIKNTKITWMGSLDHSWTTQVDARHNGHMDRWLDVKDPGGDYEGMPLTMGYYSRADIPFYYALADAFTVCDYNFCSSLTGTTPNRLHFWSGTIREKMEAASQAKVWNEDADHGAGEVNWKTYPERLEDNGISWKVYQNQVYANVGLGENQSWLDNFGDNPLEYFPHYHVRMTPEYISFLPEQIRLLEEEINKMETQLSTGIFPIERDKHWVENAVAEGKKRLAALKEEQKIFTLENFEKLSTYQKNIFNKAFTTNRNDPHYQECVPLKYKEDDIEREITIPKGDILYQFREDVKSGNLPTVSWLVAPEKFSDHPTTAWFGAWYVSEVMDILTQNPEVWKKTIFILTYDENDGYFDHVPPFGAPSPYSPDKGKVSHGIDTSVEFVRKNEQSNKKHNRESNIGLGYRVPMVIASPWTRGGFVCSEIFDHTSALRFLENFLEKKTGKKIIEENITQWRRTVCGDLSSAFRPYNGEKIELPEFLEKETFIESINNAQFKKIPDNYHPLTEAQVALIDRNAAASGILPRQEKGIRSACALPYELYVNSMLSKDKKSVSIHFEAGNSVFGSRSAGTAFYVYALNVTDGWRQNTRDYALIAGDKQTDDWSLDQFENGIYHLRAYGPNGFYRSFRGNAYDPIADIQCSYEKASSNSKKLTGNVLLTITNHDTKSLRLEISDNSYKTAAQHLALAAGKTSSFVINTEKSFGWYDVSLKINGSEFFEKQFAGHVETGTVSKTDPLMGGMI